MKCKTESTEKERNELSKDICDFRIGVYLRWKDILDLSERISENELLKKVDPDLADQYVHFSEKLRKFQDSINGDVQKMDERHKKLSTECGIWCFPSI